MKALGKFVDWLSEQQLGHVSESHQSSVTIDSLSREHADELRRLVLEAGLSARVADDVGDDFSSGEALAGIEPYSLSFVKPSAEGELVFVSTRAFGLWLVAPTAVSIVRVANCDVPFRTEAFLVGDHSTVGQCQEERVRKSPRKIVRDTTGGQLVPPDLCPYLLAEGSAAPRGDVAFEEWLARSTVCAALCLATEVHHGRQLEFSGPPRVVLDWLDPAATSALVDWFELLQDVVCWIYDVDREVELRHRLFTQEFARMAFGHAYLPEAIQKYAESALEGAKIAYAFHLQEISKDALKGLSELRKAVSDETQRIFAATRQLALSAAGALFYAIGLLAARITSTLPALLFGALLVLGMAYVGTILVVNERAVRHQRDLRGVWRSKLYRYLTDKEFEDLVQNPTAQAERLLIATMWIVLVLAAVVFASAAASHQ